MYIHEIEELEVEINDAEPPRVYKCTKEDFDDYFKNPVEYLEIHGDDILLAFNKLYNSEDLWDQLLVAGQFHLKKVREEYEQALGIIFAPSALVAEEIHKKYFPNNSVLVLGQHPKTPNIEYCNSQQLIGFLQKKKIDWLISCEALCEGFDYPNCKVSVLLPRLLFLSQNKVSQMIGRTNRVIKSQENLKAHVITLDFKPVIDLIKNDQDQKYMICSPYDVEQELQIQINKKAIEDSKMRLKRLKDAAIKDEVVEVFVRDLILSMLVNNEDFVYPSEIQKQCNEKRIRRYWVNWLDLLINENIDFYKTPPEKPGVYLIWNAKTDECLYIGSASNLQKRICNSTRFWKTSWIQKESVHDVYLKYHVVNKDYYLKEVELKRLFSPKYDGEQHKSK